MPLRATAWEWPCTTCVDSISYVVYVCAGLSTVCAIILPLPEHAGRVLPPIVFPPVVGLRGPRAEHLVLLPCARVRRRRNVEIYDISLKLSADTVRWVTSPPFELHHRRRMSR